MTIEQLIADFEQLDELSKDTLKSYIDTNTRDIAKRARNTSRENRSDAENDKIDKRISSLGLANQKLGKKTREDQATAYQAKKDAFEKQDRVISRSIKWKPWNESIEQLIAEIKQNDSNAKNTVHALISEKVLISIEEKKQDILEAISKTALGNYKFEKGSLEDSKYSKNLSDDQLKQSAHRASKLVKKPGLNGDVYKPVKEAKEDSPITGTRKIKDVQGSDGYVHQVRYNPEYEEYQVHHYKDGKHLGEGPVSYHGDDKQEAIDTANYHAENGMK
jgi:hypothetical protein